MPFTITHTSYHDPWSPKQEESSPGALKASLKGRFNTTPRRPSQFFYHLVRAASVFVDSAARVPFGEGIKFRCASRYSPNHMSTGERDGFSLRQTPCQVRSRTGPIVTCYGYDTRFTESSLSVLHNTQSHVSWKVSLPDIKRRCYERMGYRIHRRTCLLKSLFNNGYIKHTTEQHDSAANHFRREWFGP